MKLEKAQQSKPKETRKMEIINIQRKKKINAIEIKATEVINIIKTGSSKRLLRYLINGL